MSTCQTSSAIGDELYTAEKVKKKKKNSFPPFVHLYQRTAIITLSFPLNTVLSPWQTTPGGVEFMTCNEQNEKCKCVREKTKVIQTRQPIKWTKSWHTHRPISLFLKQLSPFSLTPVPLSSYPPTPSLIFRHPPSKLCQNFLCHLRDTPHFHASVYQNQP